MSFLKYPHLERLGNAEVQNIELGECHIFPKIDGTNASLWLHEGIICAGSRNRRLSLDNDNGGFMAWAVVQQAVLAFFEEYPDLRLYGEWLIPHSLKTYRETAWRRFYVFDVMKDGKFIPYEDYKPLMDKYGIDYIPPISKLTNGSYEHFVTKMAANVFMIEDGKGAGEGIVIKNYGYKNKYGRTTWAKIVTSEFKEKHAKEMGVGAGAEIPLVEQAICEKYITTALCEKEFAKIEAEGDWQSKFIPRLLNTVYYSLIKEDSWEFTKEFKNPVIDFSRLKYFAFAEVKKKLPRIF